MWRLRLLRRMQRRNNDRHPPLKAHQHKAMARTPKTANPISASRATRSTTSRNRARRKPAIPRCSPPRNRSSHSRWTTDGARPSKSASCRKGRAPCRRGHGPRRRPHVVWAGKRNRRQVPILPLQRNEVVSDSRIAHIIERARKAARKKHRKCPLVLALPTWKRLFAKGIRLARRVLQARRRLEEQANLR